jgi:general secretion pathway protein J
MTRGARGFTLLELLISVSLLALLSLMLFGGLRLGTRHIGAVNDKMARAGRIALAERFLRAELADAQSLAPPGAEGQQILFDGRPGEVGFLVPLPESAALPGLQLLTVGFVEDHPGAGGDIVVDQRPYDGVTPGGATAAHRTVLFDHVQTVAFAYFGSLTPDEAPDWHASWSNQTTLPSLFRLSAIFTDGDRLPELVVALRLSPGAAAVAQGGRQ